MTVLSVMAPSAQAEVERQIAAWYQRFAANNKITMADAKRLLNSGELAEFRWTVGQYITYGQQNAIDGAWGWTMQAVNEAAITKVLSRPWTADGKTFQDRCWTNKQDLVNSVNTQLTQMIIRGEAPDKTISAISHQFGVSKGKADRLIMTEAAAFSSAAQKDCYGELGVEQFKVVATFDKDTCEICGALDGEGFKMPDMRWALRFPHSIPGAGAVPAPILRIWPSWGNGGPVTRTAPLTKSPLT